jgi:hypothetical protein
MDHRPRGYRIEWETWSCGEPGCEPLYRFTCADCGELEEVFPSTVSEGFRVVWCEHGEIAEPPRCLTCLPDPHAA